jgi:16S rRNA (adenine1518-N6/adenine1519-N6)-dimethyltransferase
MNTGRTAGGAEQIILLGAARIRSLAAELDLKPTKMLGQNFVHDANTVRRIASVAGLQPGDDVLEVGPGLGSLTLALLAEANTGSVAAVEIDPRLAAQLPVTVAELAPSVADRLTVIAEDALTVDVARLGSPSALVANLPYNVAVPVLLRLLADLPSVRRVLVLVQAEVADRLAAEPGSRVYGVPSVKARWYGTVRRAGTVPRTVFWPVPNVDSALVALDRHPAALAPPAAEREAVFAAIDAAFSQRRKMVRSALAEWAGSLADADEILRVAGVDPARRGETLDVADFRAIAAARGVGAIAAEHPSGVVTDARPVRELADARPAPAITSAQPDRSTTSARPDRSTTSGRPGRDIPSAQAGR